MNLFIWIGIGIAFVGLIMLVAGMFGDSEAGIFGGLGAFAVAILIIIVGVMPEWRLYRASVEKRILVEQAKAEADAAVEYKRAEITRAEGVAAANIIVADSITEPYLRYLFVNNLGNTENQIIYVPTEANLPILEAGRLNPAGELDE